MLFIKENAVRLQTQVEILVFRMKVFQDSHHIGRCKGIAMSTCRQMLCLIDVRENPLNDFVDVLLIVLIGHENIITARRAGLIADEIKRQVDEFWAIRALPSIRSLWLIW